MYYVLLILALAIGVGGFQAEVAGELFAAFVLGGAVVGLAAWLMPVRWPRWLYPIAVLVTFILFRTIAVLPQASAAA